MKCRRCKTDFLGSVKQRICDVCRSACSGCGVELTEENRDGGSLKNRKNYVCKSCVAKRVRETRDKDRQKDYDLQRSYGISLDEYQKLSLEQGGLCAICSDYGFKGEVLSVDHCHETGKVRGLLCPSCNTGLGHFRDNERYLTNAIRYLREEKED